MSIARKAGRAFIAKGVLLTCLGMTALPGQVTATELFGGGSGFPAGVYMGYSFLAHGQRQSATTFSGPFAYPASVSSDALFGHWAAATNNQISYCQTGSELGKAIFAHTDGVVSLTSSGICNLDYGVSRPNFGAPANVAVDPYFAASETPLSTTDYTRFASGGKSAKYAQPVQFPAFAGSIAIVFNNADAKPLSLTDAQLCGIFDGSIVNWAQLGAPAKPIRIVYDWRGSGTAFSLANHLTAVCPGTPSTHFVAKERLPDILERFFPALPTSWIPVDGDTALLQAVNSNDGALSFVAAGTMRQASVLWGVTNGTQYIPPNIDYAKVMGRDPFADFPNKISLPILTNQVLIGVDPNTGQPLMGPLAPPVTGTSCVGVVDPVQYANNTTRYPIMAVSYLVANYQGNGTDVSQIRGLLGSPYGDLNGVWVIGSGTGNASLGLPSMPWTPGTGLGGEWNPTRMTQKIASCIQI